MMKIIIWLLVLIPFCFAQSTTDSEWINTKVDTGRWFYADDISGNDNDLIGEWINKGSVADTAKQSTSSNKPQLQKGEAENDSINGKQFLYFGVPASGRWLDFTEISVDSPDIYIVFKRDGANRRAAQFILTGGNATTLISSIFEGGTTAGNDTTRLGDADISQFSFAPPTGLDWTILRVNPTSIYKNNVDVGTSTGTYSGTFEFSRIGSDIRTSQQGTLYSIHYIATIIIIPRQLTSAENDTIYNILNSIYFGDGEYLADPVTAEETKTKFDHFDTFDKFIK